MSHIYIKLLQVFLVFAVAFHNVRAQEPAGHSYQPEMNEVARQFGGFGGFNGGFNGGGLAGCPLCDSSVYSYCSHKLAHDACCCGSPYLRLPYQCQFADCGFLHANSCQEHRLIAGCCCDIYGRK